jgi:hypothetical protein
MIQRIVLAVVGALAGVATLVAVAFAGSPSVAADPSNGTGPCVGVDGDHLPWFDLCANPPAPVDHGRLRNLRVRDIEMPDTCAVHRFRV